jgi:protein-tyrosine phosphatase
MPAILFVCTANQCRSPIAEALLKRRLARLPNVTEWRVESAGTWVVPDRPAHRQMRAAAHSQGVNLEQHRARSIDALPDLPAFDLILTMEQGQKEAIQLEHPHLRTRVHLLSSLGGAPYDIPDPIGSVPQQYVDTLREIDRLLQTGWPKLLQLAAASSPLLTP